MLALRADGQSTTVHGVEAISSRGNEREGAGRQRAAEPRYALAMASRWADWFRQAEADLTHARHALEDGHHGVGVL
jgi:hypothetical protein